MKKHLPKIVKVTTMLLSTFYFLLSTLFAQAPQKMSYQAVIRDAGGTLVTTHAVGLQFRIHQTTFDGTVVYTETQTKSTNANGLVTTEIGGGTGFDAINWATGPYFIETGIDPTGLTDYSITSVSQLLTVPYALYADKVPNLSGTNTGDETTATIKTKLGVSTLSGSNTGDQDLSGLVTTADATTALALKIDKDGSKVLSTNDYTSAEKTKLTGIEAGAQVNVKPSWNAASGTAAEILNKPTIATVATSGSYNDLSNTPTIPTQYTDAMADSRVVAGITGKVDIVTGKGLSTNDYTTTEKSKLAGIADGAEVNVQADWSQETNTFDDYIKNKPTLSIANWNTAYGWGNHALAGYITSADATTALALKVDKDGTKVLSTNDYTTIEKSKLAGIADGAEVNVQADWNQATNTADDYIKNKPTILNSQWTTTGVCAKSNF